MRIVPASDLRALRIPKRGKPLLRADVRSFVLCSPHRGLAVIAASAVLALVLAAAVGDLTHRAAVPPPAFTRRSKGCPPGEGTARIQIEQSRNRAIAQSSSPPPGDSRVRGNDRAVATENSRNYAIAHSRNPAILAPDLLEARPASAGGRPIVLSFDAGSSDRGAAEILDALQQRSIRTSIFLTGEFILRFPAIARRIAADGHEVGNHTFNHPHLTQIASGGGQRLRPGVTEEFLRDQLLRTAEVYEKTTGRKMAPIWRAPFGEENPEIRAWAARAGYSHISWTHGEGPSLDSLDWVSDETSPRYRSSRRVIDRLLAIARPGGIILMHLGSERFHDPVGREIPRLLDGLAAEGYRFARATEYLRAESLRR